MSEANENIVVPNTENPEAATVIHLSGEETEVVPRDGSKEASSSVETPLFLGSEEEEEEEENEGDEGDEGDVEESGGEMEELTIASSGEEKEEEEEEEEEEEGEEEE